MAWDDDGSPDDIVAMFDQIPRNRLFRTLTHVSNGRLAGPLAEARALSQGFPAMALLMSEEAGPEWRVMARLELESGPVFGPMGPTDFIGLWLSGSDEIEGLPLTLACAVTETVYLTDCLQPAAMRFDTAAGTFTTSTFIPVGAMGADRPVADPRKMPAFLRRPHVLPSQKTKVT